MIAQLPTRLLAALLLLFTASCASQSVTMRTPRPPQFPLNSYDAVGVLPFKYSGTQELETWARQLEGQMRASLSTLQAGFEVVNEDESGRLKRELDNLGRSIDRLDPDQLEELFGANLLAAGGFFEGDITCTFQQNPMRTYLSDWAQITNALNPPDQQIPPVNLRDGSATLTLNVRFSDLGSRRIKFQKSITHTAERSYTAQLGTEPQFLNQAEMFGECVTDVLRQFERLVAITYEKETWPVFTALSPSPMPWDETFPQLEVGVKWLQSGDPVRAEAAFRESLTGFAGNPKMMARAHYDLAVALHAQALEDPQMFDTALVEYEKAINIGGPEEAFLAGRQRCQAHKEYAPLLNAIRDSGLPQP